MTGWLWFLVGFYVAASLAFLRGVSPGPRDSVAPPPRPRPTGPLIRAEDRPGRLIWRP
jgi:hypothetical protein